MTYYKENEKIKISVFGQSHSETIGVTIEGLPSGYTPNQELIKEFLDRRRGLSEISTARREKDEVTFISGLVDGKTCGAPLVAVIKNEDKKSDEKKKRRKRLLQHSQLFLSVFLSYHPLLQPYKKGGVLHPFYAELLHHIAKISLALSYFL